MPNYCSNYVKIVGKKEEVEKFDAHFKKKHVSYAGGTSPVLDLSGKKWLYYNKVTYTNPFDNIEREEYHYITDIVEEEDYSFANFISPTKEALLNGGWRKWFNTNWGTKWDLLELNIADEDLDDGLICKHYSFTTAWSPSTPVTFKMSAEYPNLKFTHLYEEGGMVFAGKLVLHDGSILEEINTQDDEDYFRFLIDELDYESIVCPHCQTENLEYEDQCRQCNRPLTDNCTGCTHFYLEKPDSETCRARCKLSSPPKKGRIISWALTTYKKTDTGFVLSETGEKRVVEKMEKRRIPTWCPLG